MKLKATAMCVVSWQPYVGSCQVWRSHCSGSRPSWPPASTAQATCSMRRPRSDATVRSSWRAVVMIALTGTMIALGVRARCRFRGPPFMRLACVGCGWCRDRRPCSRALPGGQGCGEDLRIEVGGQVGQAGVAGGLGGQSCGIEHVGRVLRGGGCRVQLRFLGHDDVRVGCA